MRRETALMTLKELEAGNRRFVEGKPRHPDATGYHRDQLVDGQAPSVVVVGCSDSRVPPSVIFDQGLGYIFQVLTAGHVVDGFTLGSVEYAVHHLGTQLVLVLGHTGCGAVTLVHSGGEPDDNLRPVAEAVNRAILRAGGPSGEDLLSWVEDNVRGAVAGIASSEPVIAERARQGKVAVVGAVYHLDTGVVRFLEGP